MYSILKKKKKNQFIINHNKPFIHTTLNNLQLDYVLLI